MMWLVYLFCGVPLIFIIIRRLYLKLVKNDRNVCVLVLGDLGRSPRMQYHALSFAKEGFTVDFVGYSGSLPLKEIRENPSIQIIYLRPPLELKDELPTVMCYFVKILWQTITLLWTLFSKRVSNHLIMQNPPAIPTMIVCWFYCVTTDAQFTIDWHNYAYSIMALNLKESHIIVKMAKIIEMYFGLKAQNNFCVTKAMKEDLYKNWGIQAEILYDRPANEFQPISLKEKHNFLLKLSEKYDIFRGQEDGSTIFTKCVSGEIDLHAKRPGFIVSSTSWTEDEDFSILLDALQEYENSVEKDKFNLPDLICVITGKGPLKEFYLSIIKLKHWKHITIITPWLENEDYPKMIASADLGICLHTSSSGLDLPMKVVDMFGCCLPVCAYNFKCLSELVRHNENSLVFSNNEELAEQLKLWFHNFPCNKEQSILEEKYRKELHKFQEIRWHGNWIVHVLPRFKKCLSM